jgi:lipoate-protein ligase B
VDQLGQSRLVPIDRPETRPLEAVWLGRRDYRSVWALQKELAADRAIDAIPDRLLLVEHDAVLTLGRHADEGHVRASAHDLERRGIELIRVERGGEVTYHGPGQLVAYPILALSRRGLLLRPLVRALEAAMVDTCASFGVVAASREGHPGCWVEPDRATRRKIGALGIRVERGVTYHGIALNVGPDLEDFGLIDACGMPDVVSTSIAREARRPDPLAPTVVVRDAAATFARSLADRLAIDLHAPELEQRQTGRGIGRGALRRGKPESGVAASTVAVR